MTRDAGTQDYVDRIGRIQAAKDRSDVTYLIGALRDPDHRSFAAKYLGELGAWEAVPPLLLLLDAVDPRVRIAAAEALGRLGAKQARPRLREVAMHDESAGVRSWAIGALGNIGAREDLEFLLPLLNHPFLRVRGATALALGRLGDVRALGPLRVARRKLRRSPLEWYWHRRLYNEAIKSLELDAKSARGGGP